MAGFFSVVIGVLSVWVVVAIIVAYIARWSSSVRNNNDVAFIAFLWPALVIIAPAALVFHWLRDRAIQILVRRLDRLIYIISRRVVDRSEYGTLWEGRMPYGRHLEVEVSDSAGRYFIPVDPRERIVTAKQAVAWTYSIAEDDLRPVVRV